MKQGYRFQAVILLALLPLAGMAAQTGQEAKPAAAAKVPTDDAVVKLLGEAITEKQILLTINQLVLRAQQSQQATPQQIQQKDTYFYKDALETLMGAVLLKNEAKEKKIAADKAKLETSFQSVKGQFPNEAAFLKALQDQGMNETDLRRSLEDNIVMQSVLEEVFRNLPMIMDADIQKFYDENPQYFSEPEQASAAHIFMRVDRSATPEQKAEIQKKLVEIRADIESKKITFAEAAAKYSQDRQNNQNGGDLGPIKRGDLLPPLEEAIFNGKPGTLSPVVETEFGFHLVYVIGSKQAGKRPLATVRPNIQQYLEQKAKQDAYKKHVDELKAKTNVEILMTDEEWNKRHAIKG
jgi:peptidyl-prolyl cis-trans isomerase C